MYSISFLLIHEYTQLDIKAIKEDITEHSTSQSSLVHFISKELYPDCKRHKLWKYKRQLHQMLYEVVCVCSSQMRKVDSYPTNPLGLHPTHC